MSLCDPHAQPNRRQVDLCTYIYISPGPAFVTVVKAQLLSTILQLDSYWRGRSGGGEGSGRGGVEGKSYRIYEEEEDGIDGAAETAEDLSRIPDPRFKSNPGCCG